MWDNRVLAFDCEWLACARGKMGMRIIPIFARPVRRNHRRFDCHDNHDDPGVTGWVSINQLGDSLAGWTGWHKSLWHFSELMSGPGPLRKRGSRNSEVASVSRNDDFPLMEYGHPSQKSSSSIKSDHESRDSRSSNASARRMRSRTGSLQHRLSDAGSHSHDVVHA
jgi:hypothetical protein